MRQARHEARHAGGDGSPGSWQRLRSTATELQSYVFVYRDDRKNEHLVYSIIIPNSADQIL